MDIKTLLTFGHIVGVALGVGAATVTDIFFMRMLKSGKITQADYDNFAVLSRIIWSGIILLIVSGIGFLWRMHATTGTIGILQSDRFVAKLTLVGIVTLNGLVFRFVVFPKLKEAVRKQNLNHHIRLLAITGTISVSGWYSIIALSTLRGINLHYLGWMGLYLGIIAIGTLIAKNIIAKLLNSKVAMTKNK
jgi:hypothetical protein